MEAALDIFAALVTREAEKGDKDATTAVYTALMAACEKVSSLMLREWCCLCSDPPVRPWSCAQDLLAPEMLATSHSQQPAKTHAFYCF